MGSQSSSEIKYAYTNINGTRVSIPYVRLANGQWIPFQYNWYSPYYDSQRLIGSNYVSNYGNPNVRNGNLYPYSLNSNHYYVPNQVYFNGFLC